MDVMGLAYATNPVTVHGTTAYRHGEYFRQELSVVNSSTSVWETVTVAAAGQTTTTGGKFVPKTPELFTYEEKGSVITIDTSRRLCTYLAHAAQIASSVSRRHLPPHLKGSTHSLVRFVG